MPGAKAGVKESKSQGVKAAVKKTGGLTVPVYGLDGVESGVLSLPEDVFGAKVNKTLLAQATRVYLNNLKTHFGGTKTRGEVRGSTRKIRAQKGTGGARHGSVRAPIFVGGGVVFGPKFRKVELDFPKRMKKAALVSALSSKVKEGNLLGISGVEKVSGKTSQMQELIGKIAKKNLLLVTDKKEDKLKQAVRNLQKVETITFDQLNILEILKHDTLMLTKEAVEKLQGRVKRESEEPKELKVKEEKGKQ